MICELKAVGQPKQRRVPDCDIVDIGAAPVGEPLQLLYSDRVKPFRSAALVPAAGRAPQRRDRTRLLAVLLMLEIGLLGAFYAGKRYAEAQVIVVPATGDKRSIIT